MIFAELFWMYIKIGLFGFGGGYAMLSLIQEEAVERYGWITLREFTDIVAVSQLTPGPIGINSATYIGYASVRNAGYGEWWAMGGSALATLAVCLPSVVVALLVSYYFMRFRGNRYVSSALSGLRPASVGLIASAALTLVNGDNFIDLGSVVICVVAFALTWRKVHPVVTIALAGVAGALLYG